MRTAHKIAWPLLMILMTVESYGQFSSEAIKYTQFLNYLNKYYVDTIDTKALVEEAIIFHLKNLDPHSVYISAEDVQKMNEPLQGNFEGIGISFNILDDTLFVIESIPGGPSEKVGIKAGDRILKVDEENIAGVGLTNDDVFRLLRGEKGTRVSVSVKRRHVKELLEFNITRDKIPINSLDAAFMAQDATAYIKLNRFSMTTMDEFMTAAEKLKAAGARNLILDLRGNAGGYLDMAVALADQFLAGDELIVYTEGINSERKDYFAERPGLFEQDRILILIDEGSASASEIVSGAIQDWDRGLIIGRRSFGKGLVQRQLQLTDGSMIRLTTAKYYTPSGRLIQKSYSDGLEEYQSEIFDRFENGEFINPDSTHFPDSLKYETKLSKRTVFGGGGIMPDIFVPIDTLQYTDYYRSLIRQGILNQFVLLYVDKNRKKIQNRYDTFEAFRDEFIVTEELIGELTEYAIKEDLSASQDEIRQSTAKVSILLKAYVARDIWSTNEFYQIINIDDENYMKALEILNNWDQYGGQIIN
jgi:carboxyl-terminal processing protease